MQISRKFFLNLFFVIVFLFVLYLLIPPLPEVSIEQIQEKNISQIQFVKLAGKDIKVDLAQNPATQSRGLSGRVSLNKDEGMLFVFNHNDRYSFWMKDMNFSIDMIWITEDLKISYIKNNATPESYPESYKPSQENKEAKYVLEVVSGFAQENNLKIGDKVDFVY